MKRRYVKVGIDEDRIRAKEDIYVFNVGKRRKKKREK